MGCSGEKELRQSPQYWYLCLVTKMPNRDNLREERFISATGFRVISVCSGEGKPVGHEAVDVHINRDYRQNQGIISNLPTPTCQTLPSKAMMAFEKVL